MGQHLTYYHQRYWATEGSLWRPPETIILRDEAGAVIASSQMATMLLTLYDLDDPTYPIVNGVDGVDVKNARGCTITTQGVFILNLTKDDTLILDSAHTYERRRALVQYEWPMTPTKSDCLEVTFAIRNVTRRGT